MAVLQNARHPLRLAENVIRKIEECILGAGLDAAGRPIAEIAFEGRLHFLVEEDCPEGT